MKRKWDLKRLIFNISSLVDLGQEVTSSKGFNEKMKTTLYVVTGMFSVPKAALFVYDSNHHRLELLTYKGLREIDGISLYIKARHTKTFNKNEPHNIDEIRNNSFYEHNNNAFKKLRTKTFIPLFAKDEFVGAITLGKRLVRASYLQSEKDVLKVVANQMAITLHNSSLFKKLTAKVSENKGLYENMRHIYHDTIQAFAAAIDAKDAYTKNHSYRVARYAVAIAEELEWKEKDVEGIYVAGLLHDIGKIIIDSKVLNKSEGLSLTEMSEIKRHPHISYDILSKIRFPWKDVAHFVRHHHERVDGKGYPDSLTGTDLSEGMKILALADAFDAMTTDRPYRKKLSLTEALHEVKKCLGTQFDSRISNVFFRVLQKESKGETKEAQILPHLDKDFDPAIIITLLEGIIAELSA
ncbi:MAG: HD domain-containing protein [Thermodesulfovibrionales bacterium]|nr:HD domain-containing protein [Nitrospinota bacterium]MCG2708919.1 HD domain-containing protein [Thermodesulfovibrionales bacterium]MCG2813269.1 HD domain-containing protein [Thermodesulfovibrionales bacterium]